MKRPLVAATLICALAFVPLLSRGQAEEMRAIKLNEPGKTGGLPIMEAFAVRASVREWSDKDLSLQDLSDVLWAANGINRPDGRKTAPSAMNAQDVDVYAFMKDGVYRYDAAAHALVPVAAGDHRSEIMMMRPGGPGAPGAKPGERPPVKPDAKMPAPPPGAKPDSKMGAPGQPSPAPVQLILVSDISRFRMGETTMKLEWAALDTGIVSQNISLFCAGRGLATRPRAAMDKVKIKELLKLTDTQYPLLNHPVGYKK